MHFFLQSGLTYFPHLTVLISRGSGLNITEKSSYDYFVNQAFTYIIVKKKKSEEEKNHMRHVLTIEKKMPSVN